MMIIQKTMLIIMLLIVCVNVSAKELDDYKFPIVPGTEEWKNLRGRAERDKALHIPEDILQNMSTEGLIETCMNYPLYINFVLYNNYQRGIEVVIKRFRGLQMLLRRNNRSEKLIEYYNLYNKRSDSWGGYSLKLSYLELILSQDEILSDMNFKNLFQLVQICIKKVDHLKSMNLYKGGNNESSACLLARILTLVKYKPYLEKNKLPGERGMLFFNLEKYCSSPSASTPEVVVKLAKCFIADVEKGDENE